MGEVMNQILIVSCLLENGQKADDLLCSSVAVTKARGNLGIEVGECKSRDDAVISGHEHSESPVGQDSFESLQVRDLPFSLNGRDNSISINRGTGRIRESRDKSAHERWCLGMVCGLTWVKDTRRRVGAFASLPLIIA